MLNFFRKQKVDAASPQQLLTISTLTRCVLRCLISSMGDGFENREISIGPAKFVLSTEIKLPNKWQFMSLDDALYEYLDRASIKFGEDLRMAKNAVNGIVVLPMPGGEVCCRHQFDNTSILGILVRDGSGEKLKLEIGFY